MNKTELREYRQAVRAGLIRKLGGKCALCPYSNPRWLEFHHPARRKDSGDPSWRRGGLKRAIRDVERGEIVLLCFVCHRAINRILYFVRNGLLEKAVEIAGKPAPKP